ncbi:MAG: glycosyltransferase family 4 protein [Thermoanaerobaculum sp.]|nr:glycosyltransferase family 4 protein [Thermoanaerobaculum sp.]MDW7967954.1 glycosyltransferase family 1 protein [Thermoanaerobaculum sp.]
MVTVALDARKLPDFGIGSYLAALIHHLPPLTPQWRWALLVTSEGRHLLPPLAENAQVVVVEAKGYSLREQVRVPWALYALAPRLVHIPHYVIPWAFVGKMVVTVHDLIHVLFPQFLPHPAGYFYATTMIRRALSRASRVIAVSQTTAQDLVRLFGAVSHKVTVIPNGVEAAFFSPQDPQEEERQRRQLGLDQPYFLFVGNHKPHKNVETVLKAYQLLVHHRSGAVPSLALAGGFAATGPLAVRIAALGLAERVRILGFLPRWQLLAVYRGALAFLYPSLYEGFGLPVLEAAACGVPIMASDIPAVREVLGDAVLKVNPKDVVEQAQAMARLAEDGQLRSQLASAARQRAAAFRWEQTAQATLAVYRQVLGATA